MPKPLCARQRLMAGVSVLALALVTSAARAEGGAGGDNVYASFFYTVTGGAGGSDTPLGAGSNGGNGEGYFSFIYGGGGGGGAGIAGGNGGTGRSGSGGAGGVAPGYGNGNGGNGSDGVAGDASGGGSGGGGGAHGLAAVAAFLPYAVTGGNGGNGVFDSAGADVYGGPSGGGGGGGAGGFGAVILLFGGPFGVGADATGGNGGNGGAGGQSLYVGSGYGSNGGGGGSGGIGLLLTNPVAVENSATITGGNGGTGGMSFFSGFYNEPGARGGTGGRGGDGINFQGANSSLLNTGTIQGGNGGAGGSITASGATSTHAGVNGVAGSGVTGQSLTVDNRGTIAAGFDGDGVTRGNAIDFTGGTNTLSMSVPGAVLTGNIAVTGSLNLNQAIDFSFANIITDSAFGAGSLIKSGTGAVNLTGANTYTGTTTVNAGVLRVNGSTASSSLTTVNAGATLGGNGTIGNLRINDGTLAPGNSIGMLTVNGDLDFTAASTYVVEVSPTNADRANVSGAARLGGATVNAIFGAGSYVARQYTIINATGGVSGNFGAQVNTNLPTNLYSTLSYDANNTYLNLILSYAVPTPFNPNQTNVANTLTNYFNTTGGIPLAFAALSPQGLTQASGETATGAQQVGIDAASQFMGVMTDPFITGAGNDGITRNQSASAYAQASRKDRYPMFDAVPPRAPAFAERWSVWAAGFGGSQNTDGNAALGSNNSSSRLGGVAAGASYRLMPDTLAGFSLAGGGTQFDVAQGGSGRSDLFMAGLYAQHQIGNAYLTGALAYGWHVVTTDRTVAGTDRLRADFNANTFSGRLEAGKRFATAAFGLTPYAAAQFAAVILPSYNEQVISGGGAFALGYSGKHVTAARTELGLRAAKSYALTDSVVTLRGRAAWAHDDNTGRSIAATFLSLPGTSFVVNGAAPATSAMLASASVEMKWPNNISAAATFDGEFSGVARSYAGKGAVRYTW